MILSPLEKPDASLAEIRTYFNQLLRDATSGRPPMGCLIGNTAMSSLEWDAAVASRIKHHFTRMRAAFLNALQNAARQGELDNRHGVEGLADYLVGVANGYLACVRSMTPEAVRQYIQISLAQLEKRP
jgi:TetR/AcrR family transcriptional repressor of nem operon